MTETIAVLGTGDMGSAVGAALAGAGYRVVTDLSGRGRESRELAARAGIEDLGSLGAVAGAAGLFLSIVPPAAAGDLAGRAAAAIDRTGARLLYADCNAIAPATVAEIARRFAATATPFLDVGIIGPPPRPGRGAPTRFYVAGAERARLLTLQVPGVRFIDMGPDTGRASAIKMCYAALNKGVDALYTAILLAAEQLGVRSELMDELHASQTEAAHRMAARVPFLAATAARFCGEMREIAASFAAAGVTPDFHHGAEWVYDTLARTALASETRATLPASRSLDEAIEAFRAALATGEPLREDE